MATESVKVLIAAKDTASKKFKKVGKSAINMSAMLKKAAAATAVYFGARAAKRFLQSSVEAAMEQVKADELLAQSLRNAGDASLKTLIDLKKYAGQLQKVTIYGDENTHS